MARRVVAALKALAVIAIISAILALWSGKNAWTAWAEYAAGITFFVAWIAAGVWLVGRYSALADLARRRGHPAPFLPTVTALLLLTGWFACLTLLGLTGQPEHPLDYLSFAVLGTAWILMCCMASTALATGLVLLIPRRPLRLAGPRRARFPWRAYAIILLAVFSGASIAVVVTRPSINMAFRAVQLLSFGAVQFLIAWHYAKRAHFPTYERARIDDPRPPVLYLRSFSHESEQFACLPTTGFSATLVGLVEELAREPESVPDEKGRPTFEQFFGPAFHARIGTLVALGNPEEYLSPVGAAREYVPDEQWQDVFEHLAEASSCIVAAGNHTPSLEWEFTRLRQAALHRKLFVPLPPEGDGHWAEVVSLLIAAGYSAGPDNPGPGAVVAFDQDGRTEIVARGAKTADDYVQAIAAKLAEGTGPGGAGAGAGAPAGGRTALLSAWRRWQRTREAITPPK